MGAVEVPFVTAAVNVQQANQGAALFVVTPWCSVGTAAVARAKIATLERTWAVVRLSR